MKAAEMIRRFMVEGDVEKATSDVPNIVAGGPNPPAGKSAPLDKDKTSDLPDKLAGGASSDSPDGLKLGGAPGEGKYTGEEGKEFATDQGASKSAKAVESVDEVEIDRFVAKLMKSEDVEDPEELGDEEGAEAEEEGAVCEVTLDGKTYEVRFTLKPEEE